MQNFEFVLNGIKYIIPPQGYAVDDIVTGKCLVLVTFHHDIEEITFGSIFLRNFVLSYEYEHGRVKLGLNVNAPAGAAIS